MEHTYMYIVLRVPYTCNFIAIDSIILSINCRGNQMLTALQYLQYFDYSHQIRAMHVNI